MEDVPPLTDSGVLLPSCSKTTVDEPALSRLILEVSETCLRNVTSLSVTNVLTCVLGSKPTAVPLIAVSVVNADLDLSSSSTSSIMSNKSSKKFTSK